MAKNHYLSMLGITILAGALTLLTNSDASIHSQPTTTPPDPPSFTSTQPARPDTTLPDSMPILAANIDNQLTYHYVPINIYDQDAPAETLVDHYQTPPQRHLYVLAPEREYRIEADFSAYANNPTPSHTDIAVSYSHSLSDAEIGSIEVLITETYIDASQAVFYGEAKFVVDSPSGLSLRCLKPETNDYGYPTIRDSQIILNTQAGEIPDATTPIHVDWEAPWSHLYIDTYGHRYSVVDPATTDIDPYFYPDTTPSTTPPAFYSQWLARGFLPT